jgi:diacylglycerol kinase family enzyme
MRVTVIHNPNAGEGERGESLVGELSAAGYEVTYVNAKKADLEEALGEPADLILVAGGDGTVRKVATLMIGQTTPVVVIPLGTANNIAATLGVHDRPNHLAEYLRSLRPSPFDVGLWTNAQKDHPFVESVGIGIITTLMTELADRKRQERVEDKERGFADELEVLHDIIRDAEAMPVDLVADGEDLGGEYLLIEVMNIRSVGPKVVLAPDADPADGWLDLVTIRKSERQQLASFIEAVRQRKPVPALPTRRVREVRARSEDITVHCDDQLVEEKKSFFVLSIQPGAMTMLTPPNPNETGRRKGRDRRAPTRTN